MNSTAIQNILLLLFGLGAVLFVIQPNLLLGAVLVLLLIVAFLPELTSVNDLIQQGNACCAKGNYGAAIRLFNRAIRKQPGAAIAYYSRGIVQAILNNQQNALHDLSQTIQIDPNFAQAYAERGIIYLAWGKPRRALKDCDRAIQLNPNYERAYFGRGAAHSYLGNIEAAIADFTQQLLLQPTAAIYYNMGVLQLLDGKYDQAIASLTNCLRLDAQFSSAYYNRGHALYVTGDEAKALEDYQRGIEIETTGQGTLHANDEHGYYGRGLARSRLGNLEGAIADLKQAAQICQQHQNLPFLQVVMTTLAELQPS